MRIGPRLLGPFGHHTHQRGGQEMSVTQIRPCRVCASAFQPKPWQIKVRRYICGECEKERDKARQERLRANGYIRPWGKRKAKMAAYNAKPEVRRRTAERQKVRRENPEERFKMEARIKLQRAVKSG